MFPAQPDLRAPVRPLALAACVVHPLFTGGDGKPSNFDRARLREPSLHARHGWKTEPLAQPNLPGPRARVRRRSAKSDAFGETRGAFHRLATGSLDAGLTSRVASPAGCYPQFVTSLWRAHGAFFDPRCGRRL